MLADDFHESCSLYGKVIALPLNEALEMIWANTVPGPFSRKLKKSYKLSREMFFVYVVTQTQSTFGLNWEHLRWDSMDSTACITISPVWDLFDGFMPQLYIGSVQISVGDECNWKVVEPERTFFDTMYKVMGVWTKQLRKRMDNKDMRDIMQASKALVNFVGK
jgi:hypothetical protein